MNETIAIIGATGKTGSKVVAGLAGRPLRILSRSVERAAELQGATGHEVAFADLDKPETLEGALKGVERLYMATPYHPQQGARECAAISAAAAAGVKHIVKLSSHSAGIEPEVPVSAGHKMAERAIRSSGMTWSILRQDWWFDSLLIQIDSVRRGIIYFPAQGAQMTALDSRDLAEVAVAELLADQPYGGVIALTGPETLDLPETTERWRNVTQVPIRFVEGLAPDWTEGYAAAMVRMFEHYRDRGRAPFTHTVREILKRPPRTTEDFGRDVLLPLLPKN